MKRSFGWLIVALALVWPALPASAQTTGGGEMIVVIQKRPYPRRNRLEITGLGGWMPTNAFMTYFPVEGRIGYHFAEGLGIEVSGGYYVPRSNRLSDDMRLEPHFLRVTVLEQHVWYGNVDLVWTPIMGKVRVAPFNAIAYFDIYFQVGGGVSFVYNQEPQGKNSEDPLSLRPTFNVGVGNRLWLNKYLALKIDLREYLFQKQVGKGGVSQHTNIMVGLSIIL